MPWNYPSCPVFSQVRKPRLKKAGVQLKPFLGLGLSIQWLLQIFCSLRHTPLLILLIIIFMLEFVAKASVKIHYTCLYYNFYKFYFLILYKYNIQKMSMEMSVSKSFIFINLILSS